MAYLRTFKYTKSGVDGLIERKVIVLNEDQTRIGGLDLTGEKPDVIANLVKQYESVEVRSFARLPKDAPKPARDYIYPYKAFSKSKIEQFNS